MNTSQDYKNKKFIAVLKENIEKFIVECVETSYYGVSMSVS